MDGDPGLGAKTPMADATVSVTPQDANLSHALKTLLATGISHEDAYSGLVREFSPSFGWLVAEWDAFVAGDGMTIPGILMTAMAAIDPEVADGKLTEWLADSRPKAKKVPLVDALGIRQCTIVKVSMDTRLDWYDTDKAEESLNN
jgi:hypothetical protein